jgi:hypothetical protein
VYSTLAPSASDPVADWRQARDAFAHARDEWIQLVSVKGPFDAASEVV